MTALTLGLWVRPWIRVAYPKITSLGNIEGAFFQPAAWKPEYPNPAFDNAQPDDLFWAARRVMAITDEAIRAAVEAAEYSDPRATDYLSDVIIVRRDKVGLAWLTHVNPLVDFLLASDGTLTFRNIAADTRRAPEAASYEVQWARFDNTSNTSTPVGPPESLTTLSARAPADLLDEAFVEARVSARSPSNPAWADPAIVRFRRGTNGWSLVGVRRGPEPSAQEARK
jgi:hypothetical protein